MKGIEHLRFQWEVFCRHLHVRHHRQKPPKRHEQRLAEMNRIFAGCTPTPPKARTPPRAR